MGSHRRFTGRIAAPAVLGVLVTLVAGTAAWAAPSTVVKRAERTVSVLPARTITINVAYPDALEFGGAVYSGTVRILGPDPRVGGRRPKLDLISVLSEGSAEGDSVFRVRIRNANPRGTLAARAEITAITREPVAAGASAAAPAAHPAAGVRTRPPTPALARELAGALAEHGFAASRYKLLHTAVSIDPSGWAITTPEARNPLDQGNGVVIFARVRGRWRVIAEGSTLTHVAGVPAAVLRALLDVPHEGSVPAP